MRKTLTALIVAASLGAATLVAPKPAEARCIGCWAGAGIAAGLIGGAIIASSGAYAYGYPGYRPYGYAPAYYGGYPHAYYGYPRAYYRGGYYGHRRVYAARRYAVHRAYVRHHR